MLKQSIAIILASILVILSMAHAQQVLQVLLNGHEWVSQTLTNVFSGGDAGSLVRNLLALLAIPLLVGLIPVTVYWLAKRKWFPYFMQFVWVTWLIQTAALVILYKVAS